MEWKRLTEGMIARCECGYAFFKVTEGTVTWLARSVWSQRAKVPGANCHECRNRRCGKVYLSFGVPADQANGPPIAA